MPVLSPSDEAAVSYIRKEFGDAEAAKLAGDLYRIKRNPAQSFPRWLVILAALWVGAIETADKLPQILLAVPRYQATVAETKAQLMQPELVHAQLTKARNDAAASDYEVATAQANAERAKSEAQNADLVPGMTALQIAKLGVDIKTAKFQVSTAASEAIQKEQATASQAAAIKAMTPFLSSFSKALGIDPSAFGPALEMADPNNRIQDLQGAVNVSRTKSQR